MQLTFAPNLGVDPVVTCFDMDPLSLDGQIQRASIPITGEALRCTPYDAAQSIEFGDVFQLETILGTNWWHGYLKVDFLDPWDGANLESYMAIDFIELAVNKDSLGGFGVNPEDRRFEEIRIGDIDGFGWGDGAALAAHVPAVASANDDLVNLPEKLPVNRDGFGLLASGDLLPDIDADGAVEVSAIGDEPGDDWDRRSAEEIAGTYYTGSGFTRSAESSFQLGSQYTDITLSKSYTDSAATSDPVLTGDLARSYGAYPAADGNSNIGSNLPGQNNNHPFYFNFYVEPFAIDPAKPLYLTLTHGDLDTSLIEVEVRDIHANSATATLLAAGTTDDGAIESSFVVLDETTLEFDDIFTWDAARNKWHGYLEVRFGNIDTSTDEYFAIDFLELSSKLPNVGVLRVPEDFDTIQEAINAAQPNGATILVAEGTYRENLNTLGKNVVLTSYNPLDPATVAATILDGDVDNDGTGDGSVIRFGSSFGNNELVTAAVRGFTIRNGQAITGGGISGNGTNATIERNIIEYNKACYGGGIALCRGMVRNNVIRNNEAHVDMVIDAESPVETTGVGGGVYNVAQLLQNDIHDNDAEIGGGGVWESGMMGTPRIVNNLIHANSVTDTGLASAQGAGLHCTDGAVRPLVLHNTVVDNTWDGAVVNAIDESESASLWNNILWDTTDPAPTAPDTDWDRLQGSDLQFNLVGGAPGKGTNPLWNFGDNPIFENPSTPDYALQSSSAAVDAAVELIPPVLTDFAGNPRDPKTADLGALESAHSATPLGYVYIDFPSTIVEGQPLVMIAHLSDTLQALVTGGGLAWQWQLDGVDISGATSATLTIDPVGADDSGDYTAIATIGSNDYVSGPATLEIGESEEPEGEQPDMPETEHLTINPRHLFFNDVPLGGGSILPVRVTNTTGSTVSGTASVTEGPYELLYVSSPWSYSLEVGESETLYLRAIPQSTGQFVGKLTFSTGEELTMTCDAGETEDFGAAIQVTPSLLQFGYTAPSSSKDLSVTVTNTGTVPLQGIAVAGSPFSVVSPASYNIAPSGSVTLTIRFAPNSTDSYAGHVAFAGALGAQINVYGTSESGSTTVTDGIRINEVAPWNTSGLQLADGSYPGWIELYNANTEAVDLGGWTLTDDPTNTTVYPTFPAGTVIPSGGFLIAYATSNTTPPAGEFHTGFELDYETGGYIGLISPVDELIHTVDYPVMEESDQSWSYFIGEDTSKSLWDWDGSGYWKGVIGTPMAPNTTGQYTLLNMRYAEVPIPLGKIPWCRSDRLILTGVWNMKTLGPIGLYYQLPDITKPFLDISQALNTEWLTQASMLKELANDWTMITLASHGQTVLSASTGENAISFQVYAQDPDDAPEFLFDSEYLGLPVGQSHPPVISHVRANTRTASFVEFLACASADAGSAILERWNTKSAVGWHRSPMIVHGSEWDKFLWRYWTLYTSLGYNTTSAEANWEAATTTDIEFWWWYIRARWWDYDPPYPIHFGDFMLLPLQ